MGGGLVDLLITWDSTITIDKVDGKRVWLDIDNDEPDVEIDGSAANDLPVRIPDQTVEHGLDCKYYPDNDGGHGESLGVFSGFQFPKDSLNPGDSYKNGRTNAKFVGVEKVKKWDCYKFTFEHRTGKSDDDLWSKGTIWFSTKDLSLVKRTVTLHNMDFGMGLEDVENEIMRR